MRKFIKENGYMISAALVIVAIFAIGFIFGRYGKAAPSLEVAENYKPKAEASKVVIETITSEPEQPEQVQEITQKAITVRATAYCPCKKCCGKSDGITATGAKATAGRTVAVDPDVFPFGTEIIIDGRTYVAEDKGGKIRGNAIDIFFENHDEARAFGVQQLTVFVNE